MSTRINIDEITKTFLDLTLINTTSVPGSLVLPSSKNQILLAKHVSKIIKDFGCEHIIMQDNAISIFELKANVENYPSISFFAHLDTASDHGSDTKASILHNYKGGDITLKNGTAIKIKDNPYLPDYIGQDLLVTDGTSLLGGDDKSAIASGMHAVKYMLQNPDFKHGNIKFVLLPDEEIGLQGAKALDVKALKSDFGICLDCCGVGEYVTENWFAAEAVVSFKGVTAHPMNAKGKLVNSLTIATKFIESLPSSERPEHTEGREGYFWCKKIEGDTSETKLDVFIRDFDEDTFEDRKKLLKKTVKDMNKDLKNEYVKIEIKDTYINVKKGLQEQPEILDYITNAMKSLDIKPKPLIMRGGYDGSVITNKGLTTANIFTGAHNFHAITEFLPTKSLQLASEMILEIIKQSAGSKS